MRAPHPAPPYFFQNLIIAYPPIDIAHIEFAEHLIKRWTRLRLMRSCIQALGKQTTQTKTATDAQRQATVRAGERCFLQTD
jgi:hypothetical protein